MSYDSETARLIDRIQATAFYQAKVALIKDKSPGANVISIAWVAKKLRRSKQWVKDNWKKKPEDCFADFRNVVARKFYSVLADLEFDQELFEDLLCSMPRRFKQVRNSNGGETEY